MVVRYSLPNGAHDVPIWLDGSTPNTSVASANVDPAYDPTKDESIIQTNYRMYSYVNSSDSVEQVLSVDDHYGGTTTNYVYGTARLGFEYDGKGNVADFDYDPFGVTATDEELPFFGYNGEEYNPVTGLVYLRYRYYSPELGAFIAEDNYLGDDENVNSQNRYSYCEGDPINFADPTGHAKSIREQEMQYGLDSEVARFNSYANGQSSGTNLISQGTANAYIQRGADNAHAKNAAYSCESGAKTEAAIAGMTNSINSAKDSANKKIQDNIKYEEEHKLKEGDLFEPISADRFGFNCYAYAFGQTISGQVRGWDYGTKPPKTYTVDTMLRNVLLIACFEIKYISSKDSPIEDGWYRIAMRLSFDDYGAPYDPHFMKQDPDTGEWWNKHGLGKIQYLGWIDPDKTNNKGWSHDGLIYTSETRYVALKEKFWRL